MKAALPLLAFLLSSGAILSADTLDLKRTTPVSDSVPIPVMDFFRQPLLVEPKLNLSGTHIAALAPDDRDVLQLGVYELSTGTMEAAGSRNRNGVSDAYWLGSHRLIFYMGGSTYIGNVGGLFDSRQISNGRLSLIAVPPKTPTQPLLLVGGGTSDAGLTRVATAMTDGGALIEKHYAPLKTDDGFDLLYWADKEGQLAFGMASENGLLTLYRLQGDSWEKCPEDFDRMDIWGTGDNPGEIVVLGPRADGKPRPLEAMDAASGKVTEILIQDPAYDFDGQLYRDPASHNIVGVAYQRQGPRFVWFTPEYRNLQKIVDRLFPGKVVQILGTDEAGKIALLVAFSDRQPAIYSWANLEKHTAGLIKNSAPWIDPQRMRPMSVTKFRTRDGRMLDAYVTMPSGATKEHPPPLVVLPQQELGNRNYWGYNGEVQFFASRGYAVLQPAVRGSAGNTWMFPIEDEWAFQKMHDDVTDAVKSLIASGLVDRGRVAIVGTSFGGYLALCGAAFEPDLYRCAVAISAVPDWADYITDSKYWQFSSFRYTRLLRKLGDPKLEKPKFDEMSPLRHADRIHIPLLSVTSEYDLSAVTSDSKALAAAVERNHVPVESLHFVNESVGAHELDHKVELYSHVEDFLARYLMPAGTAANP